MNERNNLPSNAVISGEICGISKSENSTYITVNTGTLHGDGVYNRPRLVCFGRVKDIADRKLKEGDSAEFVCSVQSQSRPSPTDRKNPHNLVVFRIEKTSEPVSECNSFQLCGKLMFASRFGPTAAGGVITSKTKVRNDIYVKFAGSTEFIDYVCSLGSGTPIKAKGRVITGRTISQEGEKRYSQTLYVTELENLLPPQ